jgi:chromosome segregation ATPase
MGCGSILGDLFYLADSLLDSQQPLSDEWRRRHHSPITIRHSSSARSSDDEKLLAQLYNMYGEGQIDEAVFTALKVLAKQGQLRPADLAVHRARARRHSPHHRDTETTRTLRAIRSRLAQLEQARATSTRVLADLETRLSELDEHMTNKELAARQAILHDEDVARLKLAEKAELNASYERLSTQAQALREDLTRLDDLRTQLEARLIELEAVRARSDLAKNLSPDE